MAWVSVHQQIRDHRKTRALFRELNISRAEAIGTLVLLWTWALDNCDKAGKLLSCTIDDIAAASYWQGNPRDLYNALVKVRWIDDVDGDIFVHDWNDFNKPFHDYIERKAKDRLRKQRKNSAGKSMEIPLEAPQEFHVSPSPSPSPSHVPSQQEEKQGNVRKRTTPTAFSPPSVDDVRAYCQERNNRVEAQRFVDFYSSKGWKVGNQPMKDWKAAVRTWEQRDDTNRQKNTVDDQYTNWGG